MQEGGIHIKASEGRRIALLMGGKRKNRQYYKNAQLGRKSKVRESAEQ